MTGTRTQFQVEQAVFGWSNERPGVQLLGYSFASEQEAQKWKIRLIDHVRMLPIGNAPVPDTAWSYFRFDGGTAALLYRTVSSAHSTGRNNSRALIGMSGSLTTSVALGFALKGFLGGGEQSVRDGARLIVDPETCGVSEDPREYAQAWWTNVAAILARMLDEPGRPVSIIGCRDDCRLMMIVVLRAVVEDQRLARHGHLPFDSFSTYEDTHDTSVVDLPDLVFLSKRPSGPGVVERVVVDLENDTGEGPNLDEATRILDRFVKRQPALDSVPAGRAAAGAPAGYDSGTPWESHEDGHANGYSTRSGGEVRVTNRRQEPATQHTTALRNAESLEKFTTELGRLRSLCQSKQIRQQVRGELDVRALDTLAGIVETDLVRQLGSQVLETAYGKSLSDVDDGTALKHAAEYLRRGQSEVLAHLLGRAVEKRSPNDARDAGFERWRNDDPFVAPNRRRRMAPLVQRAKRARYLPLISVVAVVALLAVVFLLGVLAGRSPATEQSAAPAAVPSTVPVPTQPAVAEPVSKSVAGAVPAGYRVFSFYKADELYYPQSPCEKAQGGTWLCRWDTPPAIPAAVPVAVPVPPGQVPGLIDQAAGHIGVRRVADWGLELNDA
ncbi:hypothetical protein Amsp01_104270 [Amycolatopsis sp. NBRC 101858]|uniref:hypothetical protein n=1 Tax=Amycolatopsis sp. NBRC 101858 TaxID=3032200 RepID=UPI0024A128EC|nr:hypothetical protein [Amycolatopsis sp. NBRC 101858]GLY44404.1 hypothetical protein Amsp01_104270 [Amycolatopsis sp. NBRC 101858]